MYKITSSELNSQYNNDDYFRFQFNTPRTIDPSKVFSLSRDYLSIVGDKNMINLNKKVLANGWDDSNWCSIVLYQTPFDEFLVEAGNHRIIYSYLLGIKIKANIRYLIPKKEISKTLKNKIEAVENQIILLEQEMHSLSLKNKTFFLDISDFDLLNQKLEKKISLHYSLLNCAYKQFIKSNKTTQYSAR